MASLLIESVLIQERQENEDDSILVARLNAHEYAAADQVFSKYAPMLKRHVQSIVKSSEVARDIVQDTFLKLIEAPPLTLLYGTIRPWLYKVARNLAIDVIRKERHVVEEEPPDVEGGESPQTVMLLKNDAEIVRYLVQQLPVELKEVFILRVDEELPFKEIALILNIPLGTALWRMHRAQEIILAKMETIK